MPADAFVADPPSIPDPLEAARALQIAESSQGFVPLFTDTIPALTWQQARAIARARDDLRRRAGERLIGFKLGWTSSAMREALGIDEPNWGTLWDSQLLGSVLDRSMLRHPKIEPELVYVAGCRLDGNATIDDVRSNAAGWAVGLEVVDPRFADFGFRWLDNTADNSSAGGVALSPVVPRPVTDSPTWQVRFDDGADERVGSGAVVMGSPEVAVLWLAHQLAVEGDAIEPGMIVFTGGVAAPFDASAGAYRAVSIDLGTEVTLDVV